ncbi:hypothetical protein MRS95_23090 [Escherichia coli]|uniref:Protein YoeJ n=2 Tax=Escherichia coli TaxID=562 RepID=YOEJ_ECOLI|nr:protein YoeJ [Escherichia coli str. K-12 substr. MG1655] [Escherichia coli]YP_010283912.1 protein YoeJ [Escherichia coli str. K-12 substr. MG1655]P0DUW3.1 RecName: Full=Protein YoeJ [Escherichia coli K-12]MCI6424230.1 hypothetical protein [Shigella flexneri]MCI7296550.1 hypothetical protein [Shigella dysenteriae]MDC3428747.1 hypothetical protein [Escherichia sp. S10b]MCI4466287.1 hypothetical protein [Escherichia coli]MCI4471233.1 hypothetical protein [Escherichia coli]
MIVKRDKSIVICGSYE